MLKFITVPALGLALAFGAAACTKVDADAHAGHGHSAEAKSYPVTGTVKGFQAEGRVVILEHDKIEGFMDAMTMGFELADAKLGQGLKVGDKISATLTVGQDTYILTELKKQ
jgi:Cu(I)/Ag(I) efflux system membrane protein CusA/SilA